MKLGSVCRFKLEKGMAKIISNVRQIKYDLRGIIIITRAYGKTKYKVVDINELSAILVIPKISE